MRGGARVAQARRGRGAGGAGAERVWRGRCGALRERRWCGGARAREWERWRSGARVEAVGQARRLRRTGAGRRFARKKKERVKLTRGAHGRVK